MFVRILLTIVLVNCELLQITILNREELKKDGVFKPGADVKFICRVESEKEPLSIDWQLSLAESPNFTVSSTSDQTKMYFYTTSTLSLYNVSTENVGMYICSATRKTSFYNATVYDMAPLNVENSWNLKYSVYKSREPAVVGLTVFKNDKIPTKKTLIAKASCFLPFCEGDVSVIAYPYAWTMDFTDSPAAHHVGSGVFFKVKFIETPSNSSLMIQPHWYEKVSAIATKVVNVTERIITQCIFNWNERDYESQYNFQEKTIFECPGELYTRKNAVNYRYYPSPSVGAKFPHQPILVELEMKASGTLRCTAKSLNDRGATVQDSAEVCVQDPKVSFEIKGPNIVLEGLPIELICTGPSCDQKGELSVSWELNETQNKNFIIYQRQCLYSKQTILSFKSIEISSGGVYRCRLSSADNIAVASFHLEVLSRRDRVNLFEAISSTSFALIMVVSVATLTFFGLRFRKRLRQRRGNAAKRLLSSLSPPGPGGSEGNCENLFDKKWEFPRNLLKIGKRLGTGNFGTVYQAEARGISGDEDLTVVAVKKARGLNNHEVLLSMAQELKILSQVGGHVNIINLLGAVLDRLDKCELMIIVEYCPYGSLVAYLSENLERYQDTDDSAHSYQNLSLSNVRYGNISAEMPFNRQVLLSWCHQIARGMTHLSSLKILHGDLAARNILLCEWNIVKIGDFGLSRNLMFSNIYQKKRGELPLPWMALESLQKLQFSHQSDVWSYGIVLWEIFTFGKIPYIGVPMPDELIRRLLQGYRLEKPEFCPKNVYEVVRSCWRLKPDERPTFKELEEATEYFLEKTTRSVYAQLEGIHNEKLENRGYCEMKTQAESIDSTDGYVSMSGLRKKSSELGQQ